MVAYVIGSCRIHEQLKMTGAGVSWAATRRLVSVLRGAVFAAQRTLLRRQRPDQEDFPPPAHLPLDAITHFMRREVHREMLLDIFHAGGSFERPYGYDKAVSVRPENDHEFREAWPIAEGVQGALCAGATTWGDGGIGGATSKGLRVRPSATTTQPTHARRVAFMKSSAAFLACGLAAAYNMAELPRCAK